MAREDGSGRTVVRDKGDDQYEIVAIERLGLGEEAVDLVSTALQAPAAQDMAIVGKRSGLPLTGQVDAQDECVTRYAGATTSAFLLLATETARDERPR